VYNSEGTLPDLVARLEPVLQSLTGQFEVLLVNDASRDQSWQVILRLAEQKRWLCGIDLMRNFGQHSALLCGIRRARFDTIVTLDDDLQNPPEEIPKLLARLNEGYDVVYGTPQQQQHGLWRDLASVITKVALQAAMGAQTARQVSAFRVFRTQARVAFENFQGPYVSVDVLLTWATTRFSAVSVRHDIRRAGESNYTFAKLTTHAFNMITGFSTLPLRFGSLVGFSCTLFGFGILAYVVIRYLFVGTSVAGFPFLASIIAIFSGVQLFALGMIGEYLARMHFRMMDRPPYAVRHIVARETVEDGRDGRS
jgi:undecaprenyl-phosphate 4-deoxy-4-formamido-L-arabinose transferase